MDRYIKQLEDQNEELRKMLADATKKMYVVEWNPRNDDYNNTFQLIYEMRIQEQLFCLILEYKHVTLEKKPYRCLCGSSRWGADFESIDACKAFALEKYKSIFMEEPKL